MAARCIGIIGFGFSGLMVATHLVRQAARGCEIYIIADDFSARGMAYGTGDTAHLLNVTAGRMGAFPDAIDGFYAWMQTANGALAKQHWKLTKDYAPTDFVPRALYGEYLSELWRDTQETAAARGVMLKLVETRATRVRTEDGLAILTARGDAIAVEAAVLAIGNETKAMAWQAEGTQVIQTPWAAGALNGAAQWASPVMLVGAGLTAVDTVMSLRAAGYTGEIIATSRHGNWPAAHALRASHFEFKKDELLAQKNLRAVLRYVRQQIAETGDWRPVIDGLRPYTQTLWQKFSARDQQRFLARLMSVWNVHRHRMAAEIAAALEADSALRVEACGNIAARVEQLRPSHLINCTGSELAATRSRNPLMKQLLADGVVEPHSNGLGVAVDPSYRAWGSAHPQLYVVGSWMTGQLLESTAVPELRVQAAAIARALASVDRTPM